MIKKKKTRRGFGNNPRLFQESFISPVNCKQVRTYRSYVGDTLGAIKVKILTPIPKGRSVNLFANFITGDKIAKLKTFLANEKYRNGWNVRITITDWLKVGEGHAILVEPDGRMIASPAWTHDNCILPIGNLSTSSAEELWSMYPYKANHLKKYLEQTLDVT